VLATEIASIQPSLTSRIAVDISLLPVVVGASALACVTFGALPALRLSKRDVAASLNGAPSPYRIQIAGYGARDAIVFVEIAASVGLIVWTAMLYTLFTQVGAVHFAFDAGHVVAMRVSATAVADVADRVAAIPGVTRTGISSGMLGGGERVTIVTNAGGSTVVSRVPVGDDFLDALGIAIVRGRGFDRSDMHASGAVAILSESAARQVAPDGDALGMEVRTFRRKPAVVIGICRDAVDYGALSKAGTYAPSELYVPYEPPAMTNEAVVLARTSIDPHSTLRAIAAAAQIPSTQKPARPVILSEDLGRRDIGSAMVVVNLLSAFAGLALVLAASGVFSVISQSVAQRTREFGIRLAIGATPGRVLGMVLIRETKLIALGIGVGVVFTMALTRALFDELVRLSVVVPGPWMGALTCATIASAGALALGTYRIVRLEPAAVLRRT
jgi:hypothetical protein